jgi:aspartyl aminopeptidase
MLALYNHEEIGSRTGEGAESGTVESMVRRLVHARGGDEEDTAVTMERSVVVSNDAAHALHPAYAEKYDPDYAPVLGGGAVLKLSGTYRYATTAASAAAFARACEHAGVPMQRLTNRSDIKSGSTVGPITWARTGMQTVDVGIPLLAMHSIRETAGTADVHAMIRALRSFLELRPQREGD